MWEKWQQGRESDAVGVIWGDPSDPQTQAVMKRSPVNVYAETSPGSQIEYYYPALIGVDRYYADCRPRHTRSPPSYQLPHQRDRCHGRHSVGMILTQHPPRQHSLGQRHRLLHAACSRQINGQARSVPLDPVCQLVEKGRCRLSSVR